MIAVAPFLRLILLLGFAICWLLQKDITEVLNIYKTIIKVAQTKLLLLGPVGFATLTLMILKVYSVTA